MNTATQNSSPRVQGLAGSHGYNNRFMRRFDAGGMGLNATDILLVALRFPVYAGARKS
jgi:hypothetical protein